MSRAWPVVPLLLLGACSGETTQPQVNLCAERVCAVAGTTCDPADGECKCGAGGALCSGQDLCDAAASTCVSPVCGAGTRWAPGQAIFREVTADWGLEALAVQGTRVAVGDFDGDGRPDLFVRAGGNGVDEWDGTRRSWLLRNTGGGFEDVTESSGVRQTRVSTIAVGRPGEVVAFADVDNDGDLDVYTGMTTGVDGALAGETSELMLNDGQGHFQLGPEDSGLRRVGDADIVAGATFVDADRDGNIDLWVGQHNYAPAGTNDTIFKQDYLYKGDGAGRFSDITAQAGLTTVDWENLDDVDMGLAHSRAWSSLACDLNDDGAPELMAASYGRAPNHLWQGSLTGDGALSFTNRSVVSGYAYDDDFTWQDNEFARCYCQRFSFAEGCDEVGPPRITCSSQNWSHTTDRRPFRLGGNSGTTVCADVNNDGAMDLLTTEITHWWAGSGADQSELLLNTGEAEVRFTRPGQAATGLTRTHSGVAWDQGDMTAAVFDFDNDGWPDVYIGASDYAGNHGLLFHQTEAGKFEAVPITEGIDHHRSHGIGVADFDGDGDLDLVLGHSRARCDATLPDDCYPTRQVRMFENTLGQGGNWVQLDLQGGEGTNRSAIGARVEVSAGGVTQTQEVGGGHGHYGIQHQRVLHFGLGAACEAEVTVRWPDRSLTTQTFRVVAGHRFKVVQGQDPSLAQ